MTERVRPGAAKVGVDAGSPASGPVALDTPPAAPPNRARIADERVSGRTPRAPAAVDNAAPVIDGTPAMRGMHDALPPTQDRKLAEYQSKLVDRLALADAAIADASANTQVLAPGQALVSVGEAPANGIATKRVLYRIDALTDKDATVYDYTKSTTLTMRREQLTALLSKQVTLRTGGDIDAPLVTTLAQREAAFRPQIQKAIDAVTLQRTIGAKAYRVHAELTQRRDEILGMRENLKQELLGWMEANKGFTSVSRAWAARNSDDFWKNATDPEFQAVAPQRASIARNEAALAEVDHALASVDAGRGFDKKPTVDAVAMGLYDFGKSDKASPALADQLRASTGLLLGAIQDGHLADARLAMEAVQQPYLFLPVKGGESLHRVGGQATVLYAINQLIARGKFGDQKALITSAEELRGIKMHNLVAYHWSDIQNMRESLNPSSIRPMHWYPRFNPVEFDKEVRRVAAIEADPAHVEAAGYVRLAKAQLPNIEKLEPGITERAKNAIGAIADSPVFWENVAVGVVTAGTGSLVLTGVRGGVAGLELLNAARAAGATARGAMMAARGSALFVAGAAIDATALHTGVNLINAGMGNGAAVDFSTGSYLEAIAMYGLGDLVGIAHAARAAKAGADAGLARVVGEKARYALEDAASSTAASVVAAKVQGRDVGDEILANVPMVAGMHVVRSVKTSAKRAPAAKSAVPSADPLAPGTHPSRMNDWLQRRLAGEDVPPPEPVVPTVRGPRLAPPSEVPRYSGTADGKPLHVFDNGTVQLGEDVFAGGNFDRQGRMVTFRDGDNELFTASLGDRGQAQLIHFEDPDAPVNLGPGIRSAYSGTERIEGRGLLVTGAKGRHIGIAPDLVSMSPVTTLDPAHPLHPFVSDALSRATGPLEVLPLGADSALHPGQNVLLTPAVDGARFALFPDRSIAFLHRPDEWHLDDSRILRVTGNDGGGVSLQPSSSRLVVTLPDGRVRANGRVHSLMPTTDPEGISLGFGVSMDVQALYTRDAQGRAQPYVVQPGVIRDLRTAPDGSGRRVVAATGENGRPVIYDVGLVRPEGVILKGPDGRILAGRTGADGKVIAIEPNLAGSDFVVHDGGLYDANARGNLPDGTRIAFGRRLDGQGPAWRLVTVEGPLRDVMPSDPNASFVLKNRESATPDKPDAIVDKGTIYDVVHSPDDETALRAAALHAVDVVFTGREKDVSPVLGPMVGAFESPAAARAAIGRGDWAGIERQMRSDDQIVPPEGVRAQLWTALGLSSAQRDPMIYTTRVGSLRDAPAAPKSDHYSVSERFQVDADGDIALFEQTPAGMRRVAREDAERRFESLLPSIDARPAWNDFARGKVDVVPGRRGEPTVLRVSPKDCAPHDISVAAIPDGAGYPTVAGLAEDIAALPVAAQLNIDHISFERDNPRNALALFDIANRELLIPPSPIWSGNTTARRSIIAHEVAGHALENDDPIVHRAVMLARYLDRTGTTDPYGGVNINESFAVGMQELHAAALPERTPHFTRLATHLLRDRNIPETRASRRGLGNPEVSGQPMAAGGAPLRAANSNPPVLDLTASQRSGATNGAGARYSGQYGGKPFSVFDNGTLHYGDGVFPVTGFARDARVAVFKDSAGKQYLARLPETGDVTVEPLLDADRASIGYSRKRDALTYYGVDENGGLLATTGRLLEDGRGKPVGISTDTASAAPLERMDPGAAFADDVAKALRGANDLQTVQTSSRETLYVLPEVDGKTYWIGHGTAYRNFGGRWLVDANGSVLEVKKGEGGRVTLDVPPRDASIGDGHRIVNGRYVGASASDPVLEPNRAATPPGRGTFAKLDKQGYVASVTHDGVVYDVRFDPATSSLGDKFIYATRGKTVDTAGDIGIFVRDGNRVRPATRDEVTAQFDRIVPKDSPRYSAQQRFGVTLEPQKTGLGHSILTLRRPGEVIGRNIVVEKIPPGNYPTVEELGAYIGQMPVGSARTITRIRFEPEHDGTLGAMNASNGVLTIVGHPAWRDGGVADPATIIAHEGGHGVEAGNPDFHRLILAARWLDGVGTSRTYGGTNIQESFAVGIEEIVRAEAHSARRVPHFTRLADALMADNLASIQPEARRRLQSAMIPALLAIGLGGAAMGAMSFDRERHK